MKRAFALLATVVALLIVSCGGGGGGGSSVTPTQQYGSVAGYVYVPIGGAREAAAPTGFMPLSGATVTVSGATNTGTTNANGYYIVNNVPTGTQTVTITKEGYGQIVRPVNVLVNQTIMATTEDSAESAMMLTNSGTITVTSDPSGAAVRIDGEPMGLVTPCTLQGVAPGDRMISVSKDGYLGAAASRTVIAGDPSSVSFTLNAAVPQQDQGLNVAGEQTEPESLTGEYPIQATEGEKAELLALEPSSFSGPFKVCTISDVYGNGWRFLVNLYNSSVANAPFAGAGINLVLANYSTSVSSLNTSTVSVFGCAERAFNAWGVYRAAGMYDLLLEMLMEATAVWYLSRTVAEFDSYLNMIHACSIWGISGCVISRGQMEILFANQPFYDAWNLLFTEALFFVFAHEMGHVNLGHTIQKRRDSANPNSMSHILAHPLPWYFEWQADLFGARLLEQLGATGAGARFTLYFMNTMNQWGSATHPPPSSRLWVVHHYLLGALDYTLELQPVVTNPPFARAALSDADFAPAEGLLRPFIEAYLAKTTQDGD